MQRTSSGRTSHRTGEDVAVGTSPCRLLRRWNARYSAGLLRSPRIEFWCRGTVSRSAQTVSHEKVELE
eukprot:3809270-Prymnesium_polylepis.1